MARLNEGLSLFDAILIVPMFQISWTFFSICTGFVYFQEYQVGTSRVNPSHCWTLEIIIIIIIIYYSFLLPGVRRAENNHVRAGHVVRVHRDLTLSPRRLL